MNISAAYYGDEKYIWCTSATDTYLYRIDKTKAVMEEVLPLLDDIYMEWAFGDILCYNNSLIFVPTGADKIVKVDLTDFSKSEISFPRPKYRLGSNKYNFWTGIVHNNNLYLFGCSYPAILKVHLQTEKVEVLDAWTEQMPSDVIQEEGWFNTEYTREGNKIYFPFMNTNTVLQFDLELEEIKIFQVGNILQGYCSIQYDGSNFWLVPRNGESGQIAKWNLLNDCTYYFTHYPPEFNHHLRAFYRTLLVNQHLLLFACRSNCNMSVDIRTGEMETFPHLYCEDDLSGWRYRFVHKEKECIWILRSSEWIVWDVLHNEVKRTSYEPEEKIVQRYRDKEIKEFFDRRKKDDSFIGESTRFGLQEYLRYMYMESTNEDGEGK